MDSVLNLSTLPYPVLNHFINILPPESVDNLFKCNKELYNLCRSLRKKPIHTLCVLLGDLHPRRTISIYHAVQENMIGIKQFEIEYNKTEEVPFQFVAEFLKTRDVFDTVLFEGDFRCNFEDGNQADILRYLVENKIALKTKNCEIYYSQLYKDTLLSFLKINKFAKLTICRRGLFTDFYCTPSEVLRAATSVTSFAFLFSELAEDVIDIEEPLQRIDDDFANAIMEWRNRFEGRLLPDQHLEIKGIYFIFSEQDLSFFEKISLFLFFFDEKSIFRLQKIPQTHP